METKYFLLFLFCGNRFQMEKRMRMKKVKEVQIQAMTGDYVLLETQMLKK